ncbi:MAG: hypothetical protein J0M18_01445 [Ignavibacteria bacterium]|nr:hypothetical protein [Ignavibacteria bacterium]
MKKKEIISYLCLILIGIVFIFPVFSNASSSLLVHSKSFSKVSLKNKYKKFTSEIVEDISSDSGTIASDNFTKAFTTNALTQFVIIFFLLLVVTFNISNFVNTSSLKEKITLRLRI